MNKEISVIIPVFNESTTIERCLKHVYSIFEDSAEVLVVDGGSQDATLTIARRFNCTILSSPVKGRAYQMDFAARQAEGKFLCFLHADTFLHQDTLRLIQLTLADQKVVLGAFRSVMCGQKARRLISFHNYIKSYYAPFLYNPYKTISKGLRLFFGDQVMFCRASDYIEAGGFDLNEEVMEEAAFCLRMNKLGRLIQLKEKVYSSDRRVVEWGVAKAHITYILICSAWGFGVSTKKLAKLYPDIR